MVVGVPHGPPARVALGLLTVGGEDVATMTISPLRPGVQALQELQQNITVNHLFIAFDEISYVIVVSRQIGKNVTN